MVGFVNSLHMQSDLNPKKKLYPFSGDGVFFVPDCIYYILYIYILLYFRIDTNYLIKLHTLMTYPFLDKKV